MLMPNNGVYTGDVVYDRFNVTALTWRNQNAFRRKFSGPYDCVEKCIFRLLDTCLYCDCYSNPTKDLMIQSVPVLGNLRLEAIFF